MKMELVLSAPQDCVVQQWLVTAGDSVTEGQVVTCRACLRLSAASLYVSSH